MKKILFILLIFISSLSSANIAMPGIFQTGGSGSLSLLYPEDTLELGKVAMLEERVAIDVYKGYAVVKGQYEMFNSSTDTVEIHMGYPKYSFYEGRNIDGDFSMQYDSLNALKVLLDGEETGLLMVNNGEYSYNKENWYTWNTLFTPFDTINIEVYFIMTTDMALVREGYASKEINGVAYVLETGRYWKDSILVGDILVQLRDGIDFSDLHGVSPTKLFKINQEKKVLWYRFENLEPCEDDNLIMAFKDFDRDIDFPIPESKIKSLYTAIDETSKINTEKLEWEEKTFPNPFNLPTPVVGWVFLAIVIALVMGGLLIIFLFRRKIYRSIKK
jgi:hypothetical protein